MDAAPRFVVIPKLQLSSSTLQRQASLIRLDDVHDALAICPPTALALQERIMSYRQHNPTAQGVLFAGETLGVMMLTSVSPCWFDMWLPKTTPVMCVNADFAQLLSWMARFLIVHNSDFSRLALLLDAIKAPDQVYSVSLCPGVGADVSLAAADRGRFGKCFKRSAKIKQVLRDYDEHALALWEAAEAFWDLNLYRVSSFVPIDERVVRAILSVGIRPDVQELDLSQVKTDADLLDSETIAARNLSYILHRQLCTYICDKYGKIGASYTESAYSILVFTSCAVQSAFFECVSTRAQILFSQYHSLLANDAETSFESAINSPTVLDSPHISSCAKAMLTLKWAETCHRFASSGTDRVLFAVTPHEVSAYEDTLRQELATLLCNVGAATRIIVGHDQRFFVEAMHFVGVTSALTFRHSWFAVAMKEQRFLRRYAAISPTPRDNEEPDAVDILEKFGLGRDVAVVGKRRVFLTAAAYELLEEQLREEDAGVKLSDLRQRLAHEERRCTNAFPEEHSWLISCHHVLAAYKSPSSAQTLHYSFNTEVVALALQSAIHKGIEKTHINVVCVRVMRARGWMEHEALLQVVSETDQRNVCIEVATLCCSKMKSVLSDTKPCYDILCAAYSPVIRYCVLQLADIIFEQCTRATKLREQVLQMCQMRVASLFNQALCSLHEVTTFVVSCLTTLLLERFVNASTDACALGCWLAENDNERVLECCHFFASLLAYSNTSIALNAVTTNSKLSAHEKLLLLHRFSAEKRTLAVEPVRFFPLSFEAAVRFITPGTDAVRAHYETFVLPQHVVKQMFQL
jgi:hypothetical protein